MTNREKFNEALKDYGLEDIILLTDEALIKKALGNKPHWFTTIFVNNVRWQGYSRSLQDTISLLSWFKEEKK